MSTQTVENPQVLQETPDPKYVKPDFGQGRYSGEMERIYNACQKLFGIESKRAERISRQAGSDAGAVFRNSAAEITVSKSTKDGKVTIGDASKVKGVTVTNALAVVRAIQWIDEAGKNFVNYGHTKWKLSVNVQEWIDEMKFETPVS